VRAARAAPPIRDFSPVTAHPREFPSLNGRGSCDDAQVPTGCLDPIYEDADLDKSSDDHDPRFLGPWPRCRASRYLWSNELNQGV